MGSFFSSIPVLGAIIGNGYRPLQWAIGTPGGVMISAILPTTTNVSSTITFPTQTVEGVSTGASQTLPQPSTNNSNTSFNTTNYFFDAILREMHDSRLEATRHPVQNGAAISDHTFLIPPRIVLEIGISDSMDSYVSGQYSGYNSKSAGAYITLRNLQQARVPITLTTQLSTYPNMVITAIQVMRDNTSFHSLRRASITFEQIFMGSVSSQTLSARTNQSNTSNPGASSVQPVPSNLQGNENSSGQWSTSP